MSTINALNKLCLNINTIIEIKNLRIKLKLHKPESRLITRCYNIDATRINNRCSRTKQVPNYAQLKHYDIRHME